MGQQKRKPTFFNIPIEAASSDVKSEEMNKLAGLRSIVDKGGPSKPVTSTPRITGSLSSGPFVSNRSNEIETPMSKILGTLGELTDISNWGVGGGAATAGLPFTAYKAKGLKRVVHGTKAEDFKFFDPKKYDTHDVLGHMTHSAENPNYAGQYALGETKGYSRPGKSRLIPIVPEAENVLDLIDPNADDIAQAMAFAENKDQLINWFKHARRNVKDSNKHYYSDFKHQAHSRAPKEEHPIRAVAENIRLSPETTENMPWDAIRYHDMSEKSWAFPARTPLFSEFGAPLTPSSHTIPVSPIKMVRQDELSTGNLPVLGDFKAIEYIKNQINNLLKNNYHDVNELKDLAYNQKLNLGMYSGEPKYNTMAIKYLDELMPGANPIYPEPKSWDDVSVGQFIEWHKKGLVPKNSYYEGMPAGQVLNGIKYLKSIGQPLPKPTKVKSILDIPPEKSSTGFDFADDPLSKSMVQQVKDKINKANFDGDEAQQHIDELMESDSISQNEYKQLNKFINQKFSGIKKTPEEWAAEDILNEKDIDDIWQNLDKPGTSGTKWKNPKVETFSDEEIDDLWKNSDWDDPNGPLPPAGGEKFGKKLTTGEKLNMTDWSGSGPYPTKGKAKFGKWEMGDVFTVTNKEGKTTQIELAEPTDVNIINDLFEDGWDVVNTGKFESKFVDSQFIASTKAHIIKNYNTYKEAEQKIYDMNDAGHLTYKEMGELLGMIDKHFKTTKPKIHITQEYGGWGNPDLIKVGDKKFPKTAVGTALAKLHIKQMTGQSITESEAAELFKQLKKYVPKKGKK